MSYCLGLEGSANKLGAGVTDAAGRVLSNVRATYNAPPGQGFLPQEVARHHRANIHRVIRQALAEAGVALRDVRRIAYTRGPGMGGPLAAVALVARTLALLHGIELVPVNHCVAHIEMGRLVTGLADPVVLYASGGNTQVVAYARGRYRVLGEALDVAVGNCLDRVARELGLPNDPAPGLSIELRARAHAGRFRPPAAPELLPGVPVAVKGMDVSCSGVVTWV